jgi:tetratricopeptide (TPR) repeat protein
MLKFGLFMLFFWLFGNPFIAILVMLILLYVLDRRFVGIMPSFIKPLKRISKIKKLRQQIDRSPNEVSAKHELARLLIERKKYNEALRWLEPLQHTLEDSAEFWDDLGIGYLHTGDQDRFIASTLHGLKLNPRVKYGAPYLRLAANYSNGREEQALACIRDFQSINSSSCEAYDQLAAIYKKLGNAQETRNAIEEGLRIYRMLPRYKKRQERKWAVRLYFKKLKG